MSGLPVLGAFGELVGIVTEADLLRRTVLGTERHLSHWSALFGDEQRQAIDYVHGYTQQVGEIMTREAFSVAPDDSLNKIVAMMEAHRIKRGLVPGDGQLVGIVSRADLLRALIHELPEAICPSNDDEQIRRCILAHIVQLP